MVSANKIRIELRKKADLAHAKNLQRFFKTGEGQYGHGDIFLGLTVPKIRNVVKNNKDADLLVVEKLLVSKFHEERLTALLLLINIYKSEDAPGKKKIAKFYLDHRKYINNWDLVDLTAHKIIGDYLFDKPKGILFKLVKSNNLWDRRIAIISTFNFIGKNQFNETLKLSKILLHDDHDLIHKAVGWGLREIGKRSMSTEEEFLKKYYKIMPRTMLRYAIEKFPEKKRLAYLRGVI